MALETQNEERQTFITLVDCLELKTNQQRTRKLPGYVTHFMSFWTKCCGQWETNLIKQCLKYLQSSVQISFHSLWSDSRQLQSYIVFSFWLLWLYRISGYCNYFKSWTNITSMTFHILLTCLPDTSFDTMSKLMTTEHVNCVWVLLFLSYFGLSGVSTANAGLTLEDLVLALWFTDYISARRAASSSLVGFVSINQSFMFSGNVSKKCCNRRTCFNLFKLVKQLTVL